MPKALSSSKSFDADLDQVDFVCISLDFRSDRRETIKLMFDQLGLSERINWWIVSKHPQGGIYGCFESHYSVWNCPEFKRPYLWVFEDDLEANDKSNSRFRQILRYVQKNCPQKFDLLNLEPQPGFTQNRLVSSSRIGQIWSGFFFHTGSYVVSRSSLPQISQRVYSWYGMDIDTSLYQNCRMAGVFPPLFIQIDQQSNNDGGWRDLFGSHPSSKDNPSSNQTSGSPNSMKMKGWLIAELAQLGSWYLIFGKPKPPLIDRRVANIK